MLSLYSLIWTFLISCPMLLLIFILRRRSDYLTKYGVTFISILYIFCTVRMLFPIEFPSHQKVICDPYLFSFIMKVYADLGPSGRRTALYVIVGIWILGSIIAFLRKNREWNKVKDNTSFIADDENSYLEEQKDGSYIFHYAGFTDKVSKEDVESGGYEGYPIIKYKEK